MRNRPSGGTVSIPRSWSWSPYTGSPTDPPVDGSTPGMLIRNNRPRSGSSASSGGSARPSSIWHDEHDWALKVGPRPSLASVEAGAVTQFWVKKLSPTSKTRRSGLVKLGAARPKELRLVVAMVVSPPGRASSSAVTSASLGPDRASRIRSQASRAIAAIPRMTVRPYRRSSALRKLAVRPVSMGTGGS